MRITPFIVATLMLLTMTASRADEATCGSLTETALGRIGPSDYRTARGHFLETVEQYHFTRRVENLISGETGPIGADLNYVLVLYPNHHRAMVAMMRLGERSGTDKPQGANYTVECYFERAARFVPGDLVARMLYAQFLIAKKRNPEAAEHLKYVVAHAGDDVLARYNVGLLLCDVGDFEQAEKQARAALDGGVTRPDLINRLKAAGHWTDKGEKSASPKP